jgi:hypothetical protein
MGETTALLTVVKEWVIVEMAFSQVAAKELVMVAYYRAKKV